MLHAEHLLVGWFAPITTVRGRWGAAPPGADSTSPARQLSDCGHAADVSGLQPPLARRRLVKGQISQSRDSTRWTHAKHLEQRLAHGKHVRGACCVITFIEKSRFEPLHAWPPSYHMSCRELVLNYFILWAESPSPTPFQNTAFKCTW